MFLRTSLVAEFFFTMYLVLATLDLCCCPGFSPGVLGGPLVAGASLVEHGLSGPRAQWLQPPGSRAQAQEVWGAGLAPLGAWDLPGLGSELVSPALVGRFCTPEPPAKPH